ncbi:uncharacterized protein E5676_scaffold340G00160 [Cucumis melo var. makuwa]|uniref:Uncharacterized protein n=1 Tax=Cucumis melo var. makuwa TaxID=1194695 RepID=A0A5D3E7G0_CUCMM|nr:uncharacterized protein E6C27_scaffold219G002180 [Cucumis melo var. makuwa]TYK31626.1 uncharacterized protein E5676_scaffold340G00160 [Cucumis melo var. makuwa]
MTNPGSFMIPCSIGRMDLGHALCDVGASINLMPLKIFKKLEIEEELTMRFSNEEVKSNVVNVMKFYSYTENCNAIESLGWDYCEEEVYVELFSLEEFFKEDDVNYILEEVNVVSGARKFEP